MNQGFAFEVESGTTVTKDLTFTPTSAGEIPVSICRRSNDNGQYSYTPVVSGTVSVEQSKNYNLSSSITVEGLTSDFRVCTPTLKATVIVMNNGTYAYNREMIVRLFKKNGNDDNFYLQDYKLVRLNVGAGKEQIVQVEFTDVSPGNYLIACYHYNGGGLAYNGQSCEFDYKSDTETVTKGDANGDGRINGMDIVETVDCILNESYNQAADLYPVDTPDGAVNGMDLVELVDLVLSQDGSQNAPALRKVIQKSKIGYNTSTMKQGIYNKNHKKVTIK